MKNEYKYNCPKCKCSEPVHQKFSEYHRPEIDERVWHEEAGNGLEGENEFRCFDCDLTFSLDKKNFDLLTEAVGW